MTEISKSQLAQVDKLVKDAGRNIIDAIETIKEIKTGVDLAQPGGDKTVQAQINTQGMSRYAAKQARRRAEAKLHGDHSSSTNSQELQQNRNHRHNPNQRNDNFTPTGFNKPSREHTRSKHSTKSRTKRNWSR